jgi:diacylglycerol O-acyltransferase / wax synthase
MARTQMTPADAAWLHMDRPTNQMVVNAVMWFAEPIDWDRLLTLYEERFLAPYPRFRQRPVERRLPGGHLLWEDDPDFDLERHLVRTRLPAPGDQATLQRYIGEHLGRSLDRERPLWQVHLIDGYDGGAAVYTRIHHSVADGIALVRLLLSMTDDQPGEPLFAPPDTSPTSGNGHLGGRAVGAVTDALRTSSHLVQEGVEVLTHPGRAVELAGLAAAGAKALGKELLLPPDRRTVLKGRMGERKHVSWSTPVPLADVKAIGKAHDATVNDVLSAAVAGSLRTYLEHRDSLVDDIRALIPFNLRPLDQPLPRELGNQFGLLFASLPIGVADRRERLLEVKRRMDALKGSPEGAVAYGVLSVLGMTPMQIEKLAIDVFGSKASLVLTNVPGPTEPVYLAGSKVAGIMGWVPASGSVGLGVSVFSYAGDVVVGIRSDARLVPDPHVLVEAFDAEIAALLELRPSRPRRR